MSRGSDISLDCEENEISNIEQGIMNVEGEMYYGEAQSAESRSDFIHKIKVCLKELREARVWLLMIVRANLLKPASKLDPLIKENNEIISIFVTSIETTKQNKKIHNSKFLVRYSIFNSPLNRRHIHA